MADTDCSVPTQVLKGAASPCTGYVMNPDTEQKIRTQITYQDLQIDNLTKQSVLQQSIMKADNEELQIYAAQTQVTNTERMIYFGLGVVLSGLAIRALK